MIFIIRHGKTDLNQANVLQGRSDHPLNEEGIIEARRAAEKFKGISFSYVFSSPLQRALQTAKIIAPTLEPIKDERLIEMDYGPAKKEKAGQPPLIKRGKLDFDRFIEELDYIDSELDKIAEDESKQPSIKKMKQVDGRLFKIRKKLGSIIADNDPEKFV